MNTSALSRLDFKVVNGKGVRNQKPNGPEGASHFWFLTPFPTNRATPSSKCDKALARCVAAVCIGTASLFQFSMLPLNGGQSAVDLPEKVAIALEKNAVSLNPISAEWTIEKSSRFSLDKLMKELGLKPYSRDWLTPISVTYMFQDDMQYIRKEHVGTVFGEDQQTVLRTRKSAQEVAFDGSVIFNGRTPMVAGTRTRGNLIKNTADKLKDTHPDLLFFRPDYFDLAGYKFPGTASEQSMGPHSLILAFIKEGAEVRRAETIEFNDTSCIAAELVLADRIELFVLDPNYGWAVRHRETRTLSGELWTRTSYADYIELPGASGVWLPKTCKQDFYHWPGKPELKPSEPLFSFSFHLANVSQERLPRDQFELAYTIPGTRISDGTYPEAEEVADGYISYVVPANPKDTEKIIEAARRDALNSSQ